MEIIERRPSSSSGRLQTFARYIASANCGRNPPYSVMVSLIFCSCPQTRLVLPSEIGAAGFPAKPLFMFNEPESSLLNISSNMGGNMRINLFELLPDVLKIGLPRWLTGYVDAIFLNAKWEMITQYLYLGNRGV